MGGMESAGFLSVPALVEAAGERFRGRPALLTRESETTFDELANRTAFAAGAIRRAGITPGARVLLVAANSPATVIAWLAAIHAGVLPAAVNPELTLRELDYLGGDLEAAAVIGDESRREVAREIADGVHAAHHGIDDLFREGEAMAAHAADPLSPAAIVYTSGTTSRPKGVQVRHAAYTETGLSFPHWIGLGEAERLWACLPLFHINAQAYSLMTALRHGYGLALSEKFHASTFWRDAAALGVTEVNVIGAMLTFLERQPAESWIESPLHTIYAAPVPTPEVRDQLEQRFRVRITGGYGMSENTFGCAESPTSRDKAGSIGRPRQPASGAFVNELRVRREEGGEAQAGEDGELCFRNPLLTPGYWNAPDVTARTLVDGWLRTGDLGHVDRDGDVFLSGRLKEMIRRRGENIAPAEVEDALLAHPAVEAVAVFGVPSDVTEEEVVAAVVAKPGRRLDVAELQEAARARLAAYKVPAKIHILDELPLTPTMRVAKDELRRRFSDGAPS